METIQHDIKKIPSFEITNEKPFIIPEIVEAYQAMSYSNFLRENADLLAKLETELSEQNPEHICLEGAHIYTDEQISQAHLEQITALKHLKKWLEEKGFAVSTMLFVDDIHPEPENQIFDLEEYQTLAEKLGANFDHIVSEKSIAQHTTKILETLVVLEKVIYQGGTTKLKARHKPQLTKNGTPSCALLDSVLSAIKKAHFDFSINLLPISYKRQQDYMFKILKAAGLQPDNFLFTFLITSE